MHALMFILLFFINIMNVLGPHDINAQSQSDRVNAFWYGFKDLDSGIIKYEACLSYINGIGGCHLVDFVDVGLSTYVAFKLEEDLQNGL